MKIEAKEFWAVRCWWWRDGVDRDADEDVGSQQTQQFRRVPKALVHHFGKKIATHARSTSPGLYDVMRGTPDAEEWGGIRWEVFEEVRP